MKYASVIILSIFFSVVPLYYAVAQIQQGTQILNECNDEQDNDGDKGYDRGNVRSAGGMLLPADSECTKNPRAACEQEGKTPPCPGIVKSSELNPNTSSQRGAGMPLNIAIKNPLKVDTIEGAIKLFMDAVLRIALPFIVIFFIWSGVSFILARGKKDALDKAKKMFWYTILGTLLILGAWTITNIIIGTVNSVTG